MTSDQVTWFEEGAGSFFTSAQLLNLIQSIGAVILLTYVAWLCVNAYKDFGNELISSSAMFTIWLRATVLLMFLLFLLIN